MWIYSLVFIQGGLWLWYALLFFGYRKAWKGKEPSSFNEATGPEVCVLIALRDEEQNLPKLFKSLAEQSYANLKIYFVNDHSSDSSRKLLEDFCSKDDNRQILDLPKEKQGKKHALSYAVAQIHSPWILCTDADTEMGPNWVASMVDSAMRTNAVFVSGPVSIKPSTSWFGKWQSLEFAGLIAIGAAGIFRNRPTMCNGANILYLRDAFYEVGGYTGNEQIASGDDMFLMHRLHVRFPEQVTFCKSAEAIVSTSGKENWKEFVSQRIRWASKNGKIERKSVSWEMIGVWALSGFLLLDLVLVGLSPWFLLVFLCFFLIKMGIERNFYITILPFFGHQGLLRNFWLSELFQVFYVFTIGVLGKFVGYEWKGRKHVL